MHKYAILTIAVLAVVAVGQYLETTIPVGAGPVALVWNPVNNKVYCANVYDNTVTIIDGATNGVKATVRVRDWPYWLTWVPNGNKVYCACGESDRVTVIDGVGDTVITHVRTGDRPHAMAYNAVMNKLYVACHDDATVVVIDAGADTVLTTIPTGCGFTRLLWHPATNLVFGSQHHGDSVVLIDCDADSVIWKTWVGRDPIAMSRSPVNNLVYVGCDLGIHVLNASGDSVVASMPIDGTELYSSCWAPYPNKVYAGSWSAGRVYVIDCDSNTLLDSVQASGQIEDVVCDTVKAKVYCANSQHDQAVIIDARADTIIKSIGVGRVPTALAWNQANSRVYVGNGYDSLVSVIRDTTAPGVKEQRLIARSSRQTATVVRSILRLESKENAVLVDITGRKVAELVPGPNDIGCLGPGIYFVHQESGRRTMKVVKLR